jgi:endonuclease/exonuclease/phosphatase (EEP) superfamily protein YafD
MSVLKLKSLWNVNADWSWRAWTAARLVTLTRVYLTMLLAWSIARALFGDRWWWLFFTNSVAIYLFLPLPLVLAAALVVRRRETWIVFGVMLALFACLFGALFIPKLPPAQAGGPTLTVMTYNLLGVNENKAGIVAALRQSSADLITLQELNPTVAEAIQRDLAREYPYQALDPQPGVRGLGVISRYPLTPTGDTLPLDWVGQPQVLTLDYAGVPVTVLHAHPYATNVGRPAFMESVIHSRELQARALVDFVATHPGPLLAPMDLNANDQGVAYAIVTQSLVDSWHEVGWGPGHTFPGADTYGGSRPRLAGMVVPMWLTRIDFVFHSRHWRATSAWIGPFDGQSDHRPVVAQLTLK